MGMRSLHNNHELHRFMRFLMVGGLNTIVGYTLFTIFIFAGAGTTIAAVGATVLGVLFNFRSIGLMVFGSSGKGVFVRFVTVYVAQLAANLALLRGSAMLRISSIVAEAIILPTLAIATFLVMRRWVFNSAALNPNKVARAVE
jgi:putative flippase GtrA